MKSLQLLLMVLMLSGCSATISQPDSGAKPSIAISLEHLAEYMAGRFDTHAPGYDSQLPIEQRLTDSRQRIMAPAIGQTAFYLQLNQGATLMFYRQRIIALVLNATSGAVVQKTLRLL